MSAQRWEIIEGAVEDVLPTFPAGHFCAILSDVPYGLGTREPTPQELAEYILGNAGLDMGGDFMSKEWSIPPVSVWRETVRVCKPGAPVLIFTGTRTQDLISIGMRAGGLQVRDGVVDYCYATGFPKSLDISRALDEAAGAERAVLGVGAAQCEYLERGEKCPGHGDAGNRQSGPTVHAPATAPATDEAKRWAGYGTALKPAREPVVIGRVPLDGTVVHNVLEHGVGGLNIDGCRIGTKEDLNGGAYAKSTSVDGTSGSLGGGPLRNASGGEFVQPSGRFPANLVLTHVSREWLRLRDDVQKETVDAILAYYGADEALRALWGAVPRDAVRSGEAKVLQPGVRWVVPQGAPQEAVGRHDLPPVRSVVPGDAGTSDGPSEVLLSSVSREGERRGEAAGQASYGGVASEDGGRRDGQVPSGEFVAVARGAIQERGGLRVGDGGDATRANPNAGDADGPEVGLHPRAPRDRSSETRESADHRRGGASRERGQGRQPAREPLRGSAKESLDRTSDAREGAFPAARENTKPGSDGGRLEVEARLVPVGWLRFFEHSCFDGCVLTGTRKVATGTAHRSTSGGKNFGSDVEKPALDDMSYADPDGTETVEAWTCADGCPVAELDRQSGNRPGMSGGGVHREGYGGGMFGGIDSAGTARGDQGGASRFFATFKTSSEEAAWAQDRSRFFFCAKASTLERTFGAEDLPFLCSSGCKKFTEPYWAEFPRIDGPRPFCPECHVEMAKPAHPTVKPIELTKYLATLVLPPPRVDGEPRRLLIPYAGSGSEMLGALRAGWDEVVGIQRVKDDEEKSYVMIARARLARWSEIPLGMDEARAMAAGRTAEKTKASSDGQASLFDARPTASEIGGRQARAKLPPARGKNKGRPRWFVLPGGDPDPGVVETFYDASKAEERACSLGSGAYAASEEDYLRIITGARPSEANA